jgi:hypothetical protein
MPKIETAGRHMVTVQSAEFGESENTGTPFINLYLVNAENNSIGAWLYLSEKALQYSLKTLRDAFGFNGDFETAVEQVTGKQCSITCEFEADQNGVDKLRVKWINAPRQSVPINDQASFLKTLSAKAARIPAKTAAAAAPTRTPPAVRPPVAQRPPLTPVPPKTEEVDDGDPF